MFFGAKDEKKSQASFLYEKDRLALTALVLEMGSRAGSAFREAVRALETRDDELAGKVLEDDDVIDELEVDAELECLRSIGMRQPIREDLRFAFSVLKIVTDLERIGDEASNIAERTLWLNRRPLLKPLIDIPRMNEIATKMLSQALESFERGDAALAEAVFRADDEMDRLYHAIFDELLGIMAGPAQGNPDAILSATALLSVARHLERIGDHAVNIAERAYFMVTGRRLKKVLREAGEKPSSPVIR